MMKLFTSQSFLQSDLPQNLSNIFQLALTQESLKLVYFYHSFFAVFS